MEANDEEIAGKTNTDVQQQQQPTLPTTCATATTSTTTVFKRVQARYRQRPTDPNHVDDLHEMVDFHRRNPIDDDNRIVLLPPALDNGRITCFGLRDFPGFVYAPSALSTDLQTALAMAAVLVYCEPPHRTNIDLVPAKDSEVDNRNGESMWDMWKRTSIRQVSDAPTNKNKRYYRVLKKLAWATLGYHYDWSARAYHEGAKSAMPRELATLASVFAPGLDATAAIVNYYNEKSTMGGHRDDLEQALHQPIVSLSLGRPAVFVLGGETLESVPVLPILVRPGDVMVMGGSCRLNYHSMARLVPAALPQPPLVPSSQIGVNEIFSDECDLMRLIEKEELVFLHEFLSQHRININLRQVYDR
jgi:alkylated DNA repair protein alkB homolog 1